MAAWAQIEWKTHCKFKIWPTELQCESQRSNAWLNRRGRLNHRAGGVGWFNHAAPIERLTAGRKHIHTHVLMYTHTPCSGAHTQIIRLSPFALEPQTNTPAPRDPSCVGETSTSPQSPQAAYPLVSTVTWPEGTKTKRGRFFFPVHTRRYNKMIYKPMQLYRHECVPVFVCIHTTVCSTLPASQQRTWNAHFGEVLRSASVCTGKTFTD